MKQAQIDFLLNYFFKNENYVGWKVIATDLIINGKCVVAGDATEDRMWQGGISNFIDVKPLTNSYKCSLYTFDIENFKTSEWFKSIHKEYIAIV